MSRMSADRTWASRSALRVSIEASRTSAVAVEVSIRSPIWTAPVKSVKEPRTLVIRCRMTNVTSEWAGSMFHVPVVRPSSVAVTVMVSSFS